MSESSAGKDKYIDTYSVKSKESLHAAVHCLDKRLNRAVCSRAWYAVMQAITAAVYEHLPGVLKPEETGKPNAAHAIQRKHFRLLCEKFGKKQRYEWVMNDIAVLLSLREMADYAVPDGITREQAEHAVKIAQRVRDILAGLPAAKSVAPADGEVINVAEKVAERQG